MDAQDNPPDDDNALTPAATKDDSSATPSPALPPGSQDEGLATPILTTMSSHWVEDRKSLNTWVFQPKQPAELKFDDICQFVINHAPLDDTVDLSIAGEMNVPNVEIFANADPRTSFGKIDSWLAKLRPELRGVLVIVKIAESQPLLHPDAGFHSPSSPSKPEVKGDGSMEALRGKVQVPLLVSSVPSSSSLVG